LECLGAATDGMEAKQVIAGRPRFNTAGACCIDRDRAANRPAASFGAEKRSVVCWLERQCLAVLVEQIDNLLHWCAGPRCQHEFGRLIQGDTVKACGRQAVCELKWAAQTRPAARAHHLHRLLVGNCSGDKLDDVFLVSRFETFHG